MLLPSVLDSSSEVLMNLSKSPISATICIQHEIYNFFSFACSNRSWLIFGLRNNDYNLSNRTALSTVGIYTSITLRLGSLSLEANDFNKYSMYSPTHIERFSLFVAFLKFKVWNCELYPWIFPCQMERDSSITIAWG